MAHLACEWIRNETVLPASAREPATPHMLRGGGAMRKRRVLYSKGLGDSSTPPSWIGYPVIGASHHSLTLAKNRFFFFSGRPLQALLNLINQNTLCHSSPSLPLALSPHSGCSYIYIFTSKNWEILRRQICHHSRDCWRRFSSLMMVDSFMLCSRKLMPPFSLSPSGEHWA